MILMIESINERIKRLRIERKLTQKQVARKLNIGQSTYSACEKSGKITTERALQLAIIFNVEPQDIMAGVNQQLQEDENNNLLRQNILPNFELEEQGVILTKNEENLIKVLREFSQDDKDAVYKLINDLNLKSKKTKKRI